MGRFVILFNIILLCLYTVENTVQRRSENDVHVQLLEISSEAVFRYAKVLIKSLMINNNSVDQEVKFKVRLPKEAYITSFVIIIADRRIEALIKEKGKARDDYNKAKEDNVTAGLISQQSISDDLDLEIFQIDVNVAADAKVTFLLEYEEFLQRHAQKYSQKIFVDSNHIIPELRIRSTYKEKQKFKYLKYKTPYHKQRVLPEEGALSDETFYVKSIEWEPSEYEQQHASVGGLKEPFEVEYELELDDNGGMTYINNEGNFVYLFSGPCSEEKIMSKQIVFVIDISGSMSGNPIQQVRLAMSSILSQLREIDFFSIIIFDDISTMWKLSFQPATTENINSGKIFVRDNVKATGSTNINDALLQAIDFFGTSESVERYGQIIMFLTDGEPTVGETNTNFIRRNVRERNHVRGQCCKSTINTIAFGRRADINFLRQIANENAGTLTVIKEIDNSLAKSELVSTYNNLENPYYKNLHFNFEVDEKMLPEANFTQSILPLYDCGSEFVISGSTIPGKDIFPTVNVIGAHNDIIFDTVPTVVIVGGESEMLTRLSVYQKVKQLLKKADISPNDSVRQAANEKALKLALEYGFVTPLTSLLVTDNVPSKYNRQLDYDFEADSYDMGFHYQSVKRTDVGRFNYGAYLDYDAKRSSNDVKSRLDYDFEAASYDMDNHYGVKRAYDVGTGYPMKADSSNDSNSSSTTFINFILLISLCMILILFI